MEATVPISLVGDNLNERHRYFNKLINNSCKNEDLIRNLTNIPECTPIDRLYKIEIAVKTKNADYIIENLKDDDMLYVSKALKASWLLNNEDIINPVCLESELYPNMITTAVNKMKHWILINLKDEGRARVFYQYYYNKDKATALKFLTKCSKEVIVQEFINFVDIVSPMSLQIFCEKCPQIAKIFHDEKKIINDSKEFHDYVDFTKNDNHEDAYFRSIRCVLKQDVDLYLDVVEEHLKKDKCVRLNVAATKYIMDNRKNRILGNGELYAGWVLDVGTLARYLNNDESEELLIKLAKRSSLKKWFNEKNLAPLMFNLDEKRRIDFWRKVSSLKKTKDEEPADFGCKPFIEEKEPNLNIYKCDIMRQYMFDLTHFGYHEDSDNEDRDNRIFEKPKRIKNGYIEKLLQKYIFINFKQTLSELRTNVVIEKAQKRMLIMQAIVMKSGGKPDNMEALFDFLLQYEHESIQVKAGVVASLVKHAYIWRANEDIWEKFNRFSQDLTIDGNNNEIKYIERLHALVIRKFLSPGGITEETKNRILKNFSTLAVYPTSNLEKLKIGKALTNMLVDTVNDVANTEKVDNLLSYIVNVIDAYKISENTIHNVIPTVEKMIQNEKFVHEDLLKRLYKSNIGRKEFVEVNYKHIYTDDFYVNTLKYDALTLKEGIFIDALVNKKVRLDKFLRKLSIYFVEQDNLAERFLIALKKAKTEHILAKPIAILIGDKIDSFILEQDLKVDGESKCFNAALMSFAHLSRPRPNLDWRKGGAKYMANKVMNSKFVDINKNIEQLITWNRSARLAIRLSMRNNTEADVFAAVAKIRPTVAFKCAVPYFIKEGDNIDFKVWEAIKPCVEKSGNLLRIPRHYNRRSIYNKIDAIPDKIKAEYVTELFPIMCFGETRRLTVILLDTIWKLLPQFKGEFIERILLEYFENMKKDRYYTSYHAQHSHSYYKMMAVKYMFLCTDSDEQERRFNFFDKQGFGVRELSDFVYVKAFLDEKYVSCLPFLEKLHKRLKAKWTSISYHLDTHLLMELNKLYLKAIRDSVKHSPETFGDDKNLKEGASIIAQIFGKYIVSHAFDTCTEYYDSVMELYGQSLYKHLHYHTEGNMPFCRSVVVSIVKESQNTNYRDSANEQSRLVFNLIQELYNIHRFQLSKDDQDYVSSYFESNGLKVIKIDKENNYTSHIYLDV